MTNLQRARELAAQLKRRAETVSIATKQRDWHTATRYTLDAPEVTELRTLANDLDAGWLAPDAEWDPKRRLGDPK